MRVLVYGMVGTNRGGIETFLLMMNKYMSSDIIFDYVIEEKECIHLEEIEQKGGKVLYISKRTETPFKNIIDNYRLLKTNIKNVQTVYFNLSSLSWIIPIIIAYFLGYKVFVHAHNSVINEVNRTPLYIFVNRINKKLLSHFNITRLTCSKNATKFMFNSNDEVYMICNAIDVSKFAFSSIVRTRMRNELKISTEIIIGYVGRLSEEKNPFFLLEVLKNVINKNPNAVLFVLGDGPLREELEKRIMNMGLSNKCFLLGNKNNVADYLQAMDLFVLPSFTEGLPYSVVEAQASGLKCIVSDRVTDEVNITGNVRFLSIDSAEIWANEIINCNMVADERKMCVQFIETTSFNINREAQKLELILKGDLTC